MRTWERIEHELLSEQERATIPGYRRGGWPELLSHVGPRPTRTGPKSRRFPPPAQYLDSERSRSLIRFDAKGVEARCYRMFGRPVLFAFEVIHDDRKWEGEIRQPGGQTELWRVDSWLPNGENWAVFRLSDGRIVAKSGCDNEALTPGLYYFVGPETDAAIDHSEVPGEIEEEGPYFDIGGQDIECAYRIWTVCLAPRFEWANGAITVSDGMAPNLTFVRQGNPLAGRTHVFTRHLPPVRIDGWSEETAAHYNIVLERGSERTTLNPIAPDGLLEIDVPCPARGRVLLEPKGRLRHSADCLSSLDFVLLSGTVSWRFPEGVFSFGDAIPVRLQSGTPCEVTWHPDTAARSEGVDSWLIDAEVATAEGSLQVEGIEYDFALRVPRCGIAVPGLDVFFPIIWLDDLEGNQLHKYPPLRVLAPPGVEAELLLTNETGVCVLAHLDRVPRSGIRACRPAEFRDSLLRLRIAAGELAVRCNFSAPIGSGVFFASSELLREGSLQAPENWFAFRLPMLGPLLKKLRRLHEGPVDSLVVPTAVLASPLGGYVADCAASAAAIDRTELVPFADSVYVQSAGLRSCLDWYLRARNASAEDADVLLVQFPGTAALPVPRHAKKVQALLEEIRQLADLPGMIRKWRADVADQDYTEFRSRIAGMDGGHELTQAAHLYARAVQMNDDVALDNCIKRCIALESSSAIIVRCLAAALYKLALCRTKRCRDAAEIRTPPMPRGLARLAFEMEQLCPVCRGERPPGTPPPGIGFIDISPAEADKPSV